MFGEKESYMCVDPLRDFMSENFEPVAHFLRAISEPARVRAFLSSFLELFS